MNVEVIITIPIVAADEENTAADDTAANDAAADGTAAGSVLPSRTASLTKAVTQLVETSPETLSATLSAVQVLGTAPAKVETGVVVAIVVAPPPPPSPEGLDLARHYPRCRCCGARACDCAAAHPASQPPRTTVAARPLRSPAERQGTGRP